MRAGVIIQREQQIAMIERFREQRLYYVVPGGRVEVGESIEAAAIREAYEELGVHVVLGQLAAIIHFKQKQQYYFYATITAGIFGSGTGAELAATPDSPSGSYRAIWLDTRLFRQHDIRPRAFARLFLAGKLQPGQPTIECYE